MANDSIGSMTAIVRATADQFSSDMKSVEGSLDSMKSHGESAGSSLREAFEIAGAIELFHAAIESAQETVEKFFGSIESGGKLNIFAEQIGTTAEALGGLHFAAAQVDVSSEQMNGALQKMLRSVGELKIGTAETVQSFQQLGLSLSDLQGRTADEQFKVIADHIASLGNRADQTAAAMRIFGRSGAELLPIILQGSAAINKMAETGKQLGAVLSDEQAEAFHKVSAEMTSLKLEWDGFVAKMATDALPAIHAVASALKDFIPWLEKQIAGISENQVKVVAFSGAIIGAAGAMGAAIAVVGRLVSALKALAESESIAEALSGPAGWAALLAGAAAAITAVHFVGEAFDSIDASARSAKETGESAMEGIGSAAQRAAAQIKHVADENEKLHEKLLKKESINPHAAEQAREAYLQVGESIAKATKDADDFAKAVTEGFKKMVAQGESVTAALRTPIEKYRDAILDTDSLLKNHVITQETYNRAVAKAADELKKANEAKLEFQKTEGVGAAEVGTKEGFSAVAAGLRAQDDLNRQKVDLAQQQVTLQQAMVDALGQIVDATGGSGNPTGTGGVASGVATADF